MISTVGLTFSGLNMDITWMVLLMMTAFGYLVFAYKCCLVKVDFIDKVVHSVSQTKMATYF